ncbi:putative disease resistance protein At3g14460 [Humulus lupulus]|uniref:putative disease resistance protein At3g14460 n=1 Tax=Humulus lupulus TaxID=3486 RepID=UPI002B411EC7|nr:putative disease resistance protein At3g14460 [Humulus lupulus]
MLSPNTTLKQIEILGYLGTKFPNWIGDDSFNNIVDIKLSGSQHCSNLPPLGQLPSLKILHISSFDSVTTVGAEFYGNSSAKKKPFSSLEILIFKNCHYFEALSMSDGQCQELTYLSIYCCRSFVSFPNGGLIAPKLSDLNIYNCPELMWLPEKMTSLSSLKSLTIRSCPLIKAIPEGGLPISLSKLRINYHQLLRIKWNWQTLPNLKNTLSEEGFPTSLSSLSISGCPLLKKIYDTKDSENKEYWRKISHIPHVGGSSERQEEDSFLNMKQAMF